MLNLDHVDRRRATMAAIVTLIALPSLWLTSRSAETGAPNVATVGVTLGAETGPATPTRPAAGDALGTPGGAYLEFFEPPLDTGSTESGDGVVRIAVPAPASGITTSGRASFAGSLASDDVCLVAGVPSRSRVTVTNLDNGHSVTCVAQVPPAGTDHDVVLRTTAFARIADLTDAPVPVEITR